jgi:protein-S-isoprenylcysteine O-methyltransferase Ste14
VLFVSSLAFFVYAYLVLFGEAVPAGPIGGPVVANLALFTAFALHHSVFARAGVKRWLNRLFPASLERSAFTWVSSALFLVVCWAWQPVPGVLYRLDAPWRGGLFAVQALGVVLTFFGSRAVDVLDLGGVRPLLDARAGRTAPRHVPLVTSGVYRLVRHPIYFGWVLLVFGSPGMTATRFTFAVISTLYLAAAIPLEERGLSAAFGDDYRRYCGAVRWRMIPGVY